MGRRVFVVRAARHSYRNVPVRVPGVGSDAAGVRDLKTGRVYPAQMMGDALCWIVDDLPKGESREFEVVSQAPSDQSGVEVVESGDGRLEFRVGGEMFTAYYFGGEVVRPYLYPLIGPGGRSVTRHYPMAEDIPGETRDHVHHRSVWTAHGDVNGVDDWLENEGHGSIVHRGFIEQTSGPVFGRIVSKNDWVASDGTKVMEEERTITVYNLPAEHRYLDVSSVFRASEGDVKFGDTKEGGIISVRVATSMDGNKGGLITNSFGGVTEVENWGKRAHWCDYSGPVEGRTVGIAIFDSPCNFRYPTYWHVRDYGLMTANPFALSEYYGDKSRDGGHVVQSGELFPFTYRIFIHDGDAQQANVGEVYHGFINAPSVEVV